MTQRYNNGLVILLVIHCSPAGSIKDAFSASTTLPPAQHEAYEWSCTGCDCLWWTPQIAVQIGRVMDWMALAENLTGTTDSPACFRQHHLEQNSHICAYNESEPYLAGVRLSLHSQAGQDDGKRDASPGGQTMSDAGLTAVVCSPQSVSGMAGSPSCDLGQEAEEHSKPLKGLSQAPPRAESSWYLSPSWSFTGLGGRRCCEISQEIDRLDKPPRG